MTIYDKNTIYGTQKTLILQPSEIFNIETGIQDWNEFIIAAQFSITDTSDDNAKITTNANQLLSSSLSNQFYYGLIDNTGALPSSNNNYVGMIGREYNRNKTNFNHSISPSTTAASSTAGASIIGGVVTEGTLFTNATNIYRIATTNGQNTSLFAIRVMLRFVVNNKGANNQTISYYFKHNNTTNASGLQSETLQEIGTSDTLGGTFDWNNGVSALSLPKNIIFHCPFTIIRLRIHNLLCRIT